MSRSCGAASTKEQRVWSFPSQENLRNLITDEYSQEHIYRVEVPQVFTNYKIMSSRV